MHVFMALILQYRLLRLELLEGVVAYHSGDLEMAKKSLNSARDRYLQVHFILIYDFFMVDSKFDLYKICVCISISFNCSSKFQMRPYQC